MEALRIIRDEHRRLSAVLHGMLYLLREIRLAGARPDFAVLDAMVHYVDAFVARYHHPKEDRYLFERLRQRHPDAAPLCAQLEEEHRAGDEKIRALRQAMAGYRRDGDAAFAAFAAATAAYAAFHYDHMRVEETQLLPLAQRHLTADDWEQIDAAFLGNVDPLVGADTGQEYSKLFQRLIELAPPPLGVGRAL